MEKIENPLDNLILAFPCPVKWESMTGDERKRFCNQCSKNVYDISDLSRYEAEKLLQSNATEGICIKYYVRPDGKIKTDNCPPILKPIRKRLKKLIHTASICCAFLLSLVSISGCSNIQKIVTSPSKYAPNEDECEPYLGYSAPNEIRDAYFYVYRTEPKNQKAIQTLHQMQTVFKSTKQIDLALLDRYKKELVESNELDHALNAAVLECLILNKASNPQFEHKRLEMEEIRFDLLTQTLNEANSAVLTNEFKTANEKLSRFEHYSLKEASLINGQNKFYSSAEKWPWIDSFSKRYMVATPEQMREVIKLANTLERTKIDYPMSAKRFQKSLEIKSLPPDEQNRAFENAIKIEKETSDYQCMSAYPIVVAEYLGYDYNYLIDYDNPPIAKFRALEVLNISKKSEFIPIPSQGQEFEMYFNLEESKTFDFKKNTEWKFNPKMMPKPHSKWILSLCMFGNNRYAPYKGSVGIVADSQENRKKINTGIANFRKWDY